MTKKLSLYVGAIILALGAIVAGICFVFLGNRPIKVVPQNLKIEQIDDEFFLLADYQTDFSYQFKLETMVKNNFRTVALVESESNYINLSKQNLTIEAGKTYRFSACFFGDGAEKGEYSKTLTWKPSWQLDEVQDIAFDTQNQVLSWREVYLADFYEVRLVSFDGAQISKTTTTCQIDLSGVNVGKYDAFVVAKSDNSSLKTSLSGSGIKICIEKENQIISATFDTDKNIDVIFSQNVNEFEVFVDGQLKATFSVNATKQDSNFVVKLQTSFLFGEQQGEIVQIQSLECGQVKTSAIVQVI